MYLIGEFGQSSGAQNADRDADGKDQIQEDSSGEEGLHCLLDSRQYTFCFGRKFSCIFLIFRDCMGPRLRAAE